jgi:hypothetical protein
VSAFHHCQAVPDLRHGVKMPPHNGSYAKLSLFLRQYKIWGTFGLRCGSSGGVWERRARSVKRIGAPGARADLDRVGLQLFEMRHEFVFVGPTL